MKTLNNFSQLSEMSGRKGDPGRVDPTKQDERDNDPTRIKPHVKEPDKNDPTTPAEPNRPEPMPSPGN